MKWRRWAILIVLVLLNYIVFSIAFTQFAEPSYPVPAPTRTPAPTFESLTQGPVAWVILPTHTTHPTRTPVTPSPTPDPKLATAAAKAIVAATEAAAPTAVIPTLTPTPSPSPTPVAEAIVHVVQQGDSLWVLGAHYGVSAQAIADANGLTDPDRLAIGQRLIIPNTGRPVTTPTPRPAQQANTPRPTTARAPAPTATRPAPVAQFTAKLIWDPAIAPNCDGPAIAKQSIIRDTAGNPINGAVVRADCYNNIFDSHASGTPGEYDPGHYDFSFGQHSPKDWTCTFRVLSLNGQPVTSQVASVHFDLNDCRPNGSGHQAATLNWTKNW